MHSRQSSVERVLFIGLQMKPVSAAVRLLAASVSWLIFVASLTTTNPHAYRIACFSQLASYLSPRSNAPVGRRPASLTSSSSSVTRHRWFVGINDIQTRQSNRVKVRLLMTGGASLCSAWPRRRRRRRRRRRQRHTFITAVRRLKSIIDSAL